MDSWQLEEEFIEADMNRLDHPHYFQQNFTCDDLDTFFINSIAENKDIWNHKKHLNRFFDRLFASQPYVFQKHLQKMQMKRSLYIRLKWITYLHHLISKCYQHKFSLYQYTQKGIQIYIDLVHIQNQLGPFEEYIYHWILKPYLQFLWKLCGLKECSQSMNNHCNGKVVNKFNQEDKENYNYLNTNEENSINNFKSPNKSNNKNKCIFSLNTRSNESSQEQKDEKIMMKKQLMVHWFKMYNLITQTLQNFSNVLEQNNFFLKKQFPYLLNMSRQISEDIKILYKNLKNIYNDIEGLVEITALEMQELETKVKIFDKKYGFRNDNVVMLCMPTLQVLQENMGLQKDVVEKFMASTEAKKKNRQIIWETQIKSLKLQFESSVSGFFVQ